MYNGFEFDKDKDINIYMSPELLKCCFVIQTNKIKELNARKSNVFSIALLLSSFICNLKG